MRDLPKATRPPAPSAAERSRDDSGAFRAFAPNVVAIAIEDDAVCRSFVELVRGAPFVLGGPEVVESAAIVVTDVPETVEARARELRRRARSDAAIVLVVDSAVATDVARAQGAGAFALLRKPLTRDEVLACMAAASASHAARTGIADPTLKLDLQSHLATLGRFTAGLHHELKNPLAVVEMNVNLLREDVEMLLEGREHLRALANAPTAERPLREAAARAFLGSTEERSADLMPALDDTRASLDRMRILFARLQSFVNRGAQPVEPLEITPVVNDVRAGRAGEHLEGVDVEIVSEGASRAYASRPLLEDLLTELASNAAHAAKLLSSPRVRFHVYDVDDGVIVSVRDNGPGIRPEDQERIFDPFYTTRRHSGGVGLGLAICREYAAQMGAQLSLWSVPGRGACFRLALRRA